MWQSLRARRGKRAAIAAIGPFLEASRISLGQLPERIWSDAYVLGFLSLLTTMEATRAVGSLTSDALAGVQTEVIASLTGLPPDSLGEAIFALSLDSDREFARGCEQASVFHAALLQAMKADDFGAVAVASHDFTALQQLWTASFEASIAELL
jgi:hypothetical protein